MDIYENGQQLVFELDLPGVNPEDIRVTQDGLICQVEAEKRTARAEGVVRYLRLERNFGHICQQFRLPDYSDLEQLTAEYRNGTLRIICPRVQKRSIPIKEHKK